MRLLALLLPAKLAARMLIRSVHQSLEKRRRRAATTRHTRLLFATKHELVKRHVLKIKTELL
jgi:hypothetical protein